MFFQPQEITYDATYDERPDGEPIIMGAVATHVESGLSVECRQFGSYYRNREAAKVELEAEMARRAEVAIIASPAGAEVEGRLTPCREVDGGLVGLTVAGSDTRAAGIE